MELLDRNHEIDIDPYEAIEKVKIQGSIRIPGFIHQEKLRELSLLADELETDLLLNKKSRIRQEFEAANFRYPQNTPTEITALGAEIEQFVSRALPMWRPNDAALQRYRPQHLGIDWHRDYFRDKLLVAVATIAGRAGFEIEVYDSPYSSHAESFVTEPGDLVLLRAPNMNLADGRPYHRISAPKNGVRTSVAFRQNERLEL